MTLKDKLDSLDNEIMRVDKYFNLFNNIKVKNKNGLKVTLDGKYIIDLTKLDKSGPERRFYTGFTNMIEGDNCIINSPVFIKQEDFDKWEIV